MIKSELVRVFSDILSVDEGDIFDNSSPETIDEWDSLKQMALILAVEKKFNISFDDKDIFEMRTFLEFYSKTEHLVGNPPEK